MITTQSIKTKINVSEIKTGDIFSEESHYIYEGWNGQDRQFTHLESGRTISLNDSYVANLLTSASQFNPNTVMTVGREDKLWTAKQTTEGINSGEFTKETAPREGDLKVKGIRSIWADIHSSMVFTVNFNKQNRDISSKTLMEAREKQLAEAVTAIEDAQRNKKGVAKTAKEVIKMIQENPLKDIVKGEERTLRGYKVQFSSINGMYNVIDMGKPLGEGMRQVNVNEINWLILDNKKYLVK